MDYVHVGLESCCPPVIFDFKIPDYWPAMATNTLPGTVVKQKSNMLFSLLWNPIHFQAPLLPSCHHSSASLNGWNTASSNEELR